jgi:selT/selW/selH-like putative selenoprotein
LADYLEKQGFGAAVLNESSGGVFEIRWGDNLLFSKLKEHRFPELSEVVDLLTQAGHPAAS